MGRIVPEDLPLSAVGNQAERRVLEAFRDELTDGWLIIPNLELRAGRDREMDLVLLHEDWGIVVVEVKGHRVQIRQGVWCDSSGPLDPQPLSQAKGNAYALRDRLRALGLPDTEHLHVEHAVALPNTIAIDGNLPPGIVREQVFTAAELEDPADVLETLLCLRSANQPLSKELVEAVLADLRPDVHFSWDPEALATATRLRLDQICAEHVGALETLDANRRVFVTGRAGSGKTRLAMGWARRAYLREERVLVTCYNDPLGERMAELLPDDELLTVGPFLRVAFTLPGMPPVDVPADADHEWWNTEAVAHLQRYWPEVTDRFDTVVVDEGQDFSPAWLALLEAVLDPDGPRRLLVVADDAQSLYDRGFRPPRPDEGWAVAELQTNCRNAHRIARLLRRRLDGPKAPMVGPEGREPRWVPADDLSSAVDAVRRELDRLLVEEERHPSAILVATVSTEVRDALRSQLGLVRWEERADGVACENVHRVKGVESDTVLFVTTGKEPIDALLYVGVSRAISELVVIGGGSVADRLGLEPAP